MKPVFMSKRFWPIVNRDNVLKGGFIEELRFLLPNCAPTAVKTITMAVNGHFNGSTKDTNGPARMCIDLRDNY